MILVEVIGGLGNQMFQYGLYYKLKKMYGSDSVKLYAGRFESVRDNNGYELEKVFGIKDAITDFPISKKIVDDNNDIWSRIRRKLTGFREGYITEHQNLSFKPSILEQNMNKDLYYSGSWQSEKYFVEYKKDISEIFKFKKELHSKNKSIAEEIIRSNSVSIHVRRGDYVNNKAYFRILGDVCGEEYYNRAIKLIEQKSVENSYFIFSDDIDWVKENFSILDNKKVTFVNWNTGIESHVDMQLMSLCKHNIIANSTFSWWAAWLNSNENKLVIAPRKWFKEKKLNEDIFPSEWIKI